ncbi:MAG: hypothetical protein EZS28_001999 [Streblomastix strix]|uniref:Uncharacterized protein n=1 Tax=Streblomastix strix TaxID=222440 RepID=A0A5J4X726_9EUKA|nr:MAG: hypothetical protein EZS28_001999 [Streblomastix strix]
MEILIKLQPKEQQRVKRGSGSQMKLITFYESQTQRKLTKENYKLVDIVLGWDFGCGTGEQEEDFQKDLVHETQNLEIKPIDQNNKKHKYRKHWRSVGQSPWTIVWLDELYVTAKEGPRSVIHKIEIEKTLQQKAMDSPSNITDPIVRGSMGSLCPRETFLTNEKVVEVTTSTDSIDSGQLGVARTKPINIQTAPSTQLQGNLIREHKVEKKGGRTPVRGKVICMNTSVVANQNQSEDLQL